MKTCTKCNTSKPLTDYYREKRNRNGRAAQCKTCSKLASRQYRKDNPEVSTEYYNANAEKLRANARQYYRDNKARQSILHKKWCSSNRGSRNASQMKRHCAKLHRTFKGFDKEIDKIYRDCKTLSVCLNVEHHVDHIIPLQGKNVSGLHVPWNLQIIPAFSNLSKSNKFTCQSPMQYLIDP